MWLYAEEDGWQDTCALLADADRSALRSIRWCRPRRAAAGVSVRGWSDGTGALLEEGKAYIEIRSPSYLYEDTLESAEGTRCGDGGCP